MADGCCDACKEVCECLVIESSDGTAIVGKHYDRRRKVCVTDITVPLNETPWEGTSNSLVITPGGVDGHAPEIELVPSTDPGNALTLGSDDHPYVQQIAITDCQCITFTKSVINGVLTYCPAIDIDCLLGLLGVCNAPTGLIIS
jgi:hypothetical protein